MSIDKFTKVILASCLSEKSSRVQADRQYVFKVQNSATKHDIAAAVKELFGVEVEAVRVSNVKGKARSFKNVSGKRKDWKKAYVTVKEGQSINLGGV